MVAAWSMSQGVEASSEKVSSAEFSGPCKPLQKFGPCFQGIGNILKDFKLRNNIMRSAC